MPEKITIDKSGTNTAAIHSVDAHACLDIELRPSTYVNNVVEQRHPAVKSVTDWMLALESFGIAQKLFKRIKTMHMVKKGQLHRPRRQPTSAAQQFSSLAF